jgi:site-specific recombinase
MLDILERLDPDSDRIDLLVDLVDKLRPRRASDEAYARAQVRTLTQLLKGNPGHAWAPAPLHHDPARDAPPHQPVFGRRHPVERRLLHELKRRIAYRILPPALDETYLSDTLDRLLCREDDYQWIRAVPNADWLELFDTSPNAPPPA